MSRLIVVSNRVAVQSQSSSGNQGGLAVAVQAALREWGGIWFGWSGQVRESSSQHPSVSRAGSVTYATVDLSELDYEEYYRGFSNRTLWPLLHSRLDLAEFNRRTLAGYRRVNRLFAQQLKPMLKDDDVIWVHDYHLIRLAEQLRQLGCRQRIGFFLHTPWPPLESLLALPNHREIVRALCAFDLVGFQTDNDLYNFHSYIVREAGGRVNADGTVSAYGRVMRAGAFPISIDTARVAELAERAPTTRQNERLRASLLDRLMMIGVDRLDYSKGLVERFRAYEQLLELYPENCGRVVFLQIAPPSRGDVPEYMQIRRQLETMAGHVNGGYAEFDWTPLRYLNKGFNRRTLVGFLRLARVGVVTPLRDGMNLVAKEFVAAQDPRDPGVLVLSRFAGAAAELDGAVVVNPHDVEGMAEAMHSALSMSIEARRERWQTMYRRLQTHDVDVWCKSFLDVLQEREAVV